MMDTHRIEVSIEEFKSRIPALFPYIEWNTDGTVETHAATDSNDGCYGKIIDNMKIPADVRLTNYIQIQEDEVNKSYEWNDGNTIGLTVNLEDAFSNSVASYLRKVLRYWYVYVKSGTIEEIPESDFGDGLPTFVSDESPNGFRTPKKGLNGMVILCDDVVLYDYYEKRSAYYYYERVDIIKPCETYSYRTIISNYYKYKNIVGSENSFVKFVENGIGLVIVDRHLLNLEDTEKYPEVPEFVYLAQVKQLKTKYDNFKNAYVHYNTYYLANGKISVSLKEKADKYVKMGGDNFTNWLGQIIQKAYDIANYYKCLADNKSYPVRVNTNVMLCKHTQNLGLESVLENAFVAGNRYYDGDILTYEGKTYICKIDRLLPGGDNYQYIRKSVEIEGSFVKGLFELNGSQDEYTLISNANVTYVSGELWDGETFYTGFVVVDGQYYKWDDSGSKYRLINVKEYSTGLWDDESERYVFDWQHFIPISEMEDYDEWYDEGNLFGDKFKFFVDLDYIPAQKVYDYVRFNGGVFVWDETGNEYVPIEGTESVIEFTTNSKLRELRKYNEYVNEFGTSEEPGMEEDWLYYYKVGCITGKIVETDSLGNIVSDTDDFIINQPCYDLHAYGNVITSITYSNIDNTLTFTYVIGAHLVAIAAKLSIDEDGNEIRYYKDFYYDENSGDGIVFTETYNCKDNSVFDLGNDFDDYVTGDTATLLRHMYQKFPFETIPIEAFDGSVSVLGTGVATFDVHTNMLFTNTVREEWMNGIYFQPKVKSNVLVDRGNGASFERHIRLGEIRTMEDFDNYQNGSFYKFSESYT